MMKNSEYKQKFLSVFEQMNQKGSIGDKIKDYRWKKVVAYPGESKKDSWPTVRDQVLKKGPFLVLVEGKTHMQETGVFGIYCST